METVIRECTKHNAGCLGYVIDGVRADGKSSGYCGPCTLSRRQWGRSDNTKGKAIYTWMRENRRPLIPKDYNGGSRMFLPTARQLLDPRCVEQMLGDLAVTSVVDPPIKPTRADRDWFKSVKDGVSTRGYGEKGNMGPRKARMKTPGPKKFLNESEFILLLNKFGRVCALCSKAYGSWWGNSSHSTKISPEQMHVTTTVAEGGTYVDVYPGCPICNKIQNNQKGYPSFDAARASAAKIWARLNLFNCTPPAPIGV